MPEAVLITGASTGIGEATAALCAREGLTVFAGVRTDEDAARLGSMHPNLRPVRIDVTDRGSIEAAAAELASGGHVLRGVVNNAGIAVGGPLETLSLDAIRHQFEVNVLGALSVTQVFLPLLRAAGSAATRAKLIFIGSISGRLPIPFIAPYSASKFALRALVDALRVELRPWEIEVVLIEPGSVKTPIWRKGRDSRADIEASMGPAAVERYAPALQSLFNQVDGEEKSAIPVERVAREVVCALQARRPRARYLIGFAARAASVVALLPPRVRDRIVRRSMRLP